MEALLNKWEVAYKMQNLQSRRTKYFSDSDCSYVVQVRYYMVCLVVVSLSHCYTLYFFFFFSLLYSN